MKQSDIDEMFSVYKLPSNVASLIRLDSNAMDSLEKTISTAYYTSDHFLTTYCENKKTKL